MTSLRLAEAFIRTAVPEGHEPLRDLAELRAHMDGTHQLGVAGMLPLHVLMHLHEQEHAEPGWHGSPDSSRSSEFTARRRPMGLWDMIRQAAGDSPFTSQYHPDYPPMGGGDPAEEQFHQDTGYRRLDVHNAAMRSLGLGESDSMRHFSPRMETGHYIGVGLRYPDQRWYAQVIAPPGKNRDAHPLGAAVHLDLGHDDESVPAVLHQRLRHPEVMRWLGATMESRGRQ